MAALVIHAVRLHPSTWRNGAGGGSGGVEIKEVDVATPAGRVLARRLTLAVRRGRGLLVTGPNGSGASPVCLAVQVYSS